MDEINWEDRLIGIKGSRGVGKTTFLLDYAREYFGADNKECLYINLNHFYFTERTLVDFAAEFRAKGGKVLLIDQVFKYSDWSRELRYCYDNFEDLKIVFSGSSVMRLKEENPDLSGKVVSYNLRGFSFREFLNLMSGNQFPAYTFDEVLENHQEIAKRICSVVRPMAYFQDYLHHGFYPFFLEKRNFSENLLKTMNMMLEVDVLYIKQIEQSFPKKPSKVYMYNSNLMYPIRPMEVNAGAVRESFFYNQLLKDNKLNEGIKNAHFLVNTMYNFRIEENMKVKNNPDMYYAVDKTEIGEGNMIPLWLFGFLY